MARDTLPVVITICTRGIVALSNLRSFLPRSDIREAEADRFPELVIENNLAEIRAAAVDSLTQLLCATNTLQLFSFDEIFSEALNRLTDQGNPDVIYDALPDLSDPGESCGGILDLPDTKPPR